MKKSKHIRSILFSLLLTSCLMAVPAAPHMMSFEQPDGSQFQGFLKGDEYFSWIQTENQEVVVQNPTNGFFEFGKLSKNSEGFSELVPSGTRVVERGFGSRRLPSYLEQVSRSALGQIWERKRQKRLKEMKIPRLKE